MKFTVLRRCRRVPSEQQYIWASMGIFARLPKERQTEIRELVKSIADCPEEARALFDVAVRRFTPAGVSARTGVSVQRIYKLREEFYERLPL